MLNGVFKGTEVPYHPSLEEVLKAQCGEESLGFSVTGLVLSDFVNSENKPGDISSPSFGLFAGSCSSEFGTFNFPALKIDLVRAVEKELQNLEGSHPTGAINFYRQEMPTVVIEVNPTLFDQLIPFLASGFEKLSIKIGIPSWEDKEAKCLPLIWYQLTYLHRSDFEESKIKSSDESVLAEKFDGITKGLRMGMAEIYGQLLSFDKQNIEDDKPSVAIAFLQQQASELEQNFDEFMDAQTKALEEYYEYRAAINKLFELSDKYGYEEEK